MTDEFPVRETVTETVVERYCYRFAATSDSEEWFRITAERAMRAAEIRYRVKLAPINVEPCRLPGGDGFLATAYEMAP